MGQRRKSGLSLVIFPSLISIAIFLPVLVEAGNLEPSSPPGPTMKTLDEIPPTWSRKLDSTNGSTIPFQQGCGSSRFECIWFEGSPISIPQAVLDKETGLVWARNAQTLTPQSWFDAMLFARDTFLAERKGWRLPTVEEILTLIDETAPVSPKLPVGHPFVNTTPPVIYWTSTTGERDSSNAYYIDTLGNVYTGSKDGFSFHIWLVRGGVK